MMIIIIIIIIMIILLIKNSFIYAPSLSFSPHVHEQHLKLSFSRSLFLLLSFSPHILIFVYANKLTPRYLYERTQTDRHRYTLLVLPTSFLRAYDCGARRRARKKYSSSAHELLSVRLSISLFYCVFFITYFFFFQRKI